ncbi:UNVERIFIED_CONTAM: hypothetical protein K2H54_059528 [Gekko kuhli]
MLSVEDQKDQGMAEPGGETGALGEKCWGCWRELLQHTSAVDQCAQNQQRQEVRVRNQESLKEEFTQHPAVQKGQESWDVLVLMKVPVVCPLSMRTSTDIICRSNVHHGIPTKAFVGAHWPPKF